MDGGNEPYGCPLSAAAVGRKASQIIGSVWTVGLAEGMMTTEAEWNPESVCRVLRRDMGQRYKGFAAMPTVCHARSMCAWANEVQCSGTEEGMNEAGPQDTEAAVTKAKELQALCQTHSPVERSGTRALHLHRYL